MSTYEPGTYAIATVRGVPNVRVMRSSSIHDRPLWMLSGPQEVPDTEGRRQSFAYDEDVTDVRPLVTLDLKHPQGFLDALHEAIDLATDRHLAPLVELHRQIEAQAKPPKPTEPIGLGAVVEDGSGRRYVRYETDNGWHWLEGTASHQWDHIPAVRVLSEGVTA